MDLIEQIHLLWDANKDQIEEQIGGWVRELVAQQEPVLAARRQFHQWAPLRVYTSVAQAKRKGAPRFSLRYRGQEVATLILRPDGKLYVVVGAKTQSVNAKYFGVPVKASKSFPWDSPEGKEFRSHFKEHARQSLPGGRSQEHLLESMIIQEMRLKTSGKLGEVVSQIQPVLLHGILPFQVPVPLSASGGELRFLPNAHGNIDILARRKGKDGRIRLSVWELKRPGQIDHAVRQSVIYGVLLRKMLRSRSGGAWYKLFGFRRALPASLIIESVVVLSESKRKECEAQIAELGDCHGASLKGDQLVLSAAFYDAHTFQMTDFEEGKTTFQ